MAGSSRYWFPAKRHGWGWGLPSTWQGWAVLAAFFALAGLGAARLLPSWGPATFVAYIAVLCLLLLLVCWWKGEPPGWRGRKRPAR
jgi:hypothetical protein